VRLTPSQKDSEKPSFSICECVYLRVAHQRQPLLSTCTMKKEAAITVNATNALRGRLEETMWKVSSPAKMSAADDSYLATRLREVASTAPSNIGRS
jgi:hypothetical protein